METAAEIDQRISEAKAIHAHVKRLREQIETTLDCSRPSIAPKTSFPKLEDILFDPERSRMDRDQHHVYQGYRLGGWKGLITAVAAQCRRHRDHEAISANQDPSATDLHRHLCDDYDDGSKKMCGLLLSMCPEIIEAVIEGNITSRAYDDSDFHKIVTGYTHLKDTPCIYINELVNREMDNDIQSKYPGRCLNWHEWRLTLDTLQEYLDNVDVRPKNQLIKDISTQVAPPGAKPKNADDDRYLVSKASRVKLQDFIDSNRARFVTPGIDIYNADKHDPRLEIAFKRVPREIGWGLHGWRRASQHATQQATNWLFGLFDSTIRYLFGKDRFECKTYAIVHIYDPYMAPCGEYVASQMGFSYFYQGGAGLNPELAGNMGLTGSTKAITLPKYKPLFDEVTRDMVRHGKLKDRIEEQQSRELNRIRVQNKFEDKPFDEWWDEFSTKRDQLKARVAELLDKSTALVIKAHRDRLILIRDQYKR